jgi:flagellar biosynthetic protein FlhB
MAEQELDRSEAATPFKLEEARKRGVVSKSVEVNSAVSVLSGLLAIAAFGPWMTRRLLTLSRRIFAGSDQQVFDLTHLQGWLGSIAGDALFALSPVLALVVIGSVLANILQSGPVFSAAPLKPDFTKLSPATGLKRLFSTRTLFDGLKSIVKLVIYVSIAYLFLRSTLPLLPTLYHRAPRIQAAIFGGVVQRLLSYLVVGALFIASADLIFSRWEFLRRMRMSRRELKDEIRRREGDPHVRRRRRESQREMRRRSASLGKVKDSDVLITNPQHFAVALKYRRGKAVAPEVMAKGAGELARQMRAVAFRHRIPIVPNPRLARALYREVRIGRPIPEAHYAAVADVLRWVYQIRQRREGQGKA